MGLPKALTSSSSAKKYQTFSARISSQTLDLIQRCPYMDRVGFFWWSSKKIHEICSVYRNKNKFLE